MRTGVIPGLALLLAVGAAHTARADDDTEALIRQGNALRKQGDDARAYGYFKRAYESAHTARTAAQLALVEMSLERFEEAELHFSEALAGSDPWIEQNRATLDDSRGKVRANLGRIEIPDPPAGSTIAVRDRPAVAIPADGLIWVKPGAAEIRISAPRRETVVRHVSIETGASVRVDLPAPTAAATQPTSAASLPASAASVSETTTDAGDAGGTLRVAGIVAASVGAAVGIAGLFVYRAGAAKVDSIEEAARKDLNYEPVNGNYATLGNAGIGMMIGGGAAAVAGAAIYLVGRGQRGGAVDAPAAQAAIDFAPGGGVSVRVSGRF